MTLKRFSASRNGIAQPDWTVSDNGYGLLEGSLKLFYNHNDEVPSGIPKRGDAHPYDDRLYAFDVSTTIGKNQVAYVDAKYIGIASGNVTEPEWSISGSTSDESIVFHPDFDKMCQACKPKPYIKGEFYAQDPESKRTGVVLNDGNFEKFGIDHPTVPAIEQFVSPTATCEVTFYTKDIEIATFALNDNLGGTTSKIPYAPAFLTADGEQNWMLTSTSVSPYGMIYKCSWTFTLSVLGKKHNKYIYKDLGSQQRG